MIENIILVHKIKVPVVVVHDATTFQNNFYNLNYPASYLALPPNFQWTGFIAFLTSLDIHSPHQTPHQSRMDFVQQFLSLKPEEMFKTVNRDPPTTFLFGLIAICGIVLTMTIIFIIGLCNLCRTAPSIKDSEESVTLVETPV